MTPTPVPVQLVAHFSYPIVFALPLVLIVLGIYLARVLTQRVDP